MLHEFETLRAKLKTMHEVLLEVSESFAVFEKLSQLIAPNVVGDEEAHTNVKKMNQYSVFFKSTLDAHRVRAMLKLSHMFDKHRDALSLIKLLNIAEGQRTSFTAETFVQANPDRKLHEDNGQNYEGIKMETITHLRSLIASKQDSIDLLISHRDQYLAHTDWKAVQIKITVGDIQDLISVAEKVLNDLSLELNRETFSYNFLINESKKDVEMLAADL